MPRSSCLLEILKKLSQDELEIIRSEYCDNIRVYKENRESVPDFRKRIRRELKKKREKNKVDDDFDCKELVSFIIEENLGGNKVNYLIKDTLDNIHLTGDGENFSIVDNSPSESITQAEVYQALHSRLEEKRNYFVDKESMHGNDGKPDIEVEHKSKKNAYRVEVKKNRNIISKNGSTYDFLDQLKKYRDSSDRNKEVKLTYAFVVVEWETYLPGKHDQVDYVLNKIEEMEDVKLIKKLCNRNDLEYEYTD